MNPRSLLARGCSPAPLAEPAVSSGHAPCSPCESDLQCICHPGLQPTPSPLGFAAAPALLLRRPTCGARSATALFGSVDRSRRASDSANSEHRIRARAEKWQTTHQVLDPRIASARARQRSADRRSAAEERSAAPASEAALLLPLRTEAQCATISHNRSCADVGRATPARSVVAARDRDGEQRRTQTALCASSAPDGSSDVGDEDRGKRSSSAIVEGRALLRDGCGASGWL